MQIDELYYASGLLSPIFLMRLCKVSGDKLLLQLCVCISSRLNLGLIRFEATTEEAYFLIAALAPNYRKERDQKFGELNALW